MLSDAWRVVAVPARVRADETQKRDVPIAAPCFHSTSPQQSALLAHVLPRTRHRSARAQRCRVVHRSRCALPAKKP
jgi:hypothetical protein